MTTYIHTYFQDSTCYEGFPTVFIVISQYMLKVIGGTSQTCPCWKFPLVQNFID